MIHLLLAIPPEAIRLAPYVPVVNQAPVLTAGTWAWSRTHRRW